MWCSRPFVSEDEMQGRNVSLIHLHYSDVGRVKKSRKQSWGQSKNLNPHGTGMSTRDQRVFALAFHITILLNKMDALFQYSVHAGCKIFIQTPNVFSVFRWTWLYFSFFLGGGEGKWSLKAWLVRYALFPYLIVVKNNKSYNMQFLTVRCLLWYAMVCHSLTVLYTGHPSAFHWITEP